MDSDSAAVQSVSRWTRVATAAGALGFGLTAGGVLLGIYSRMAGSTVPLSEDGVKGEDFFGSFSDEPIHGVPERFGLAAVILGILVLAVVVGAVVYRSRRPNTRPPQSTRHVCVAARGIAVLTRSTDRR